MAVYRIEGCQWNCYTGTTVLINKLGITDQRELDSVEKQITLLRGTQAEQETEFRDVDFEFYKSLHGTLFGDLYDWAGKLRTINISKKGTVFCKHTELEHLGTLKFARLRELDFLCGMPDSKFLDELTEFYHEMNMLHPFREGNGRTLRLFVTLLVRNTGRDIDFARCDTDLLTIAAVRAAQGDTSLLRDTLSEVIG
ncbi:MAG: Fic family protein [Ruminococcus sp.]|nr:Fic family protein [Ruminococcus sp.]